MSQPDSSHWHHHLCLAVLCLIVVGVYAGGTQGPLILDDRSVLDPVREAVGREALTDSLFSETGHLGRPVSMLSFALDAWLSGGDDSVAKWVNVVIHLVNVVMVGALARQLFHGVAPAPAACALWVTAFWALLPLHVSTVLYTVQRMTLLSAMGVLAGLNVLCATLRATSGARVRHGLLGLSACLVLACLAKENGILLLPLAALLAGFPLVAHEEARSRLLLARGLTLASVGGLVAFACWFLLFVLPANSEVYMARGWTPLERLLIETHVLWLYVAQVFVPQPQWLSFHHDDWSLSGLWPNPFFLLAGIGWVCLIGLALVRRDTWPLAGFGLLFFLVGHSLEASVVPLELVFEHRNYLPSLGLCLVAGALGSRLPMGYQPRSAVAGLWLLVTASMTVARCLDWGSAGTLAVRNYELNPDSPRAASTLAGELVAAGRVSTAIEVLRSVAHPGTTLQAAYLECVTATQRRQPLDTALPRPDGLSVDGYVTTAAIHLSDAIHEGLCAFPPGEFAIWLREVVTRGHFVHATEREKLALHVAHGLKDAGDRAAAVDWAASHVSGAARPVALLLAADWQSEAGNCVDARAALNEARVLREGSGSPAWRDMLRETDSLLSARGCETSPQEGKPE